ncbi:hypothetical protein LCGC14_1024340, partial [marine sediment metagenome]
EKYANASEEVLPGRYVLYDQTLLHDVTFPYMGQIQMYLHSDKAVKQGIEQWLLLVKNRDSGAVMECLIDKDPEYLAAITTRWKNFWVYMLAGRLPNRNFEKTSDQCKYCPFQKRCWGALAELPKKKVELEETEELLRATELWREGKVFEKKAGLRLDWSKLQFENEAINQKANRLSVDGIDIIISDREREGLNTDYVRSLLARLVKEKALTPEEAKECFTVTEYTQMNVKDRQTK